MFSFFFYYPTSVPVCPGTISINTLRTAYTAPGESEILDLDDNLYLGGLPENKMGLVFPTEVWTALLNYGYVGCIRDLFIDGQSKDVRRLAEVQKAAGVKPSCSKEHPKQCLSNPCQNNGICREGWNRYVCDCSGTGYLGRSCERGRTFIHRLILSSLFWLGVGFFCLVHFYTLQVGLCKMLMMPHHNTLLPCCAPSESRLETVEM